MTRPLQSMCADCDETFPPEQIGQPCPDCDEPLRDAEDIHQERWERQQEEWASEPPISASEQYEQAALQRRKLRSGLNY